MRSRRLFLLMHLTIRTHVENKDCVNFVGRDSAPGLGFVEPRNVQLASKIIF